MSLLETPSYSATQYRNFEIPDPCSGGINLKDLEYEQDESQSPNVLNMMYRNGSFCKRYGQEYHHDYTDTIYDVGYFKGDMIVHAGTKIYKGTVVLATGIAAKRGLFINFNRKLYYINDKFYQYDTEWKEVSPYVPDVVINRKPDGSYSDTIENYNRVGTGFKNTFHGDGESKVYVLTDKNLDNKAPIVEVNGSVVSNYTVDYTNGKITFTTAPSKGTNNVVITAYKTEQEYIDTILKSKYYAAYGGDNNSRLFLAGGGESIYYYSEVFDATYFPEQNYATVGNGEEDITGFGEQYDVLMVFKPTEIYAIEYYIDSENKGAFTAKQVNARIGCDAPHSIQLINNLLVWLSTTEGVCTLVSTNIEDERNVRIISRNIEGGYRISGLMQEENLKEAVSVDWDNKYFLTINGRVYMWDYLMTPYANTGKLDQDAKRLAWFLFDNFSVYEYLKAGRELYYASGSKMIKLNQKYDDFGNPIHAVYQTPFLQFNAVEYLKTVKNMYVQCRADTISVINIKYFTEETPQGEDESEPIIIYGTIWDNFLWNTFGWAVVNFANVFRRKCSLKKIQMASVLFENNEAGRDMAISHLSFQYTVVKNIK